MSIIEKINQIRRKIIGYNSQINQCSMTTAGRVLQYELKGDRDSLYYELGKLVSNSGVKICLQ